MVKKLLLGGLFGVAIGATTGWFLFDSIAGAIGLGCSISASVCGALIGFTSDRSS